MRSLDELFAALANSAFRRRFHLGNAERAYVETRGLTRVLVEAEELIGRRLAPASPRNDGKQTPFRGHPVFIAQHATATCCRGCLAKWHEIPRGEPLTDAEQAHVIATIERWLRGQLAGRPGTSDQGYRCQHSSINGPENVARRTRAAIATSTASPGARVQERDDRHEIEGDVRRQTILTA